MAGQLGSSGKVFSQLSLDSDIIDNQKELVSFPLFTNESPTLTSIYTASYMSNTQKQYYLDVVSSPDSNDAEFSIAYGHIDGSGSLRGDTYTYPSKAIYSQYKQLLLEPGETLFKFKDGTSTNHIYVINFKRERFKQRIDPGNWELTLTTLNGRDYPNNEYTGSNIDVSGVFLLQDKAYRITLTDDSNEGYESVSSLLSPKKSHNVVYKKESIEPYDYNLDQELSNINFGLLFPENGVVVIDPNKLNTYLWFNTVTGSNIQGDNPQKAYTSMYYSGQEVKVVPQIGPMPAQYIDPTIIMEGRGNEIVTSTYYYCRVKNSEYNFSTNPSFTTGSLGDLRHLTMVNDPKTYITTVGLYNNRQELLAVAKMSKPILKTFHREANIKVKLDW